MEKRIALAQLRRTNLKAWMEKNSISQTDLAKILETTKGYVCGLFMQDKFFGEKIGRKIEEVLSMPRYYLDSSGLPQEATLNWSSPADLGGLQGLVPRVDLLLTPDGIRHQTRQLPALAFTQAWLLRQNVQTPRDLCFWQTVDGSMEPHIAQGDLVLLDLSQTTVQDGQVYAIQQLNQLRLRRVSRSFGGGLLLQSDHALFPTEVLTPEQAATLSILGKCLWRSG